MKKTYLTILLSGLCILYAGSFAYSDIAPRWTEFCPKQFLNPKLKTDEEIQILSQKEGELKAKQFPGCRSEGEKIKKIRDFSILFADDCSIFADFYTKQAKRSLVHENMEKQYWIDRKNDFDKSINQCKKLPKKKQSECFSQLRHKQLQINSNEQLNLKDTELYKTVEIKDLKKYDKKIDIQNLPKYHNKPILH